MSITAVIIDTREPSWVQALKFGSPMATTSLLEHGDLLAACDDGALLAIERKTPSDLLNTIREDRLWAQLAGIKSVTPWAYLMITGELHRGEDGKVWTDGRATGWSWAAVQGALVQAQEMGVFVTYAGGDSDYEAAVIRLSQRSHNAEVLVPPAKEPRIFNDSERILCSLPGVGPERVGAILEYVGESPAWALTWLTMFNSPDRVPGIGPGVKAAIRKALRLSDEYELAVVCRETGQIVPKEEIA